MKVKTMAALLAVLGMCLVAGCGGGDKANNTPAPAGPGPSGGNTPNIPPPVGGAPGGTGPQGVPPPPVSH